MTVQILRGDARALPLADNTVDLIVTSPPYFALRSYTDQGEHYGGQIGSESTPTEWLDALIDCTREMMRVLKPSGSLFVNLGDKYSGAQAQNINGANRAGDSARTWAQTNPKRTGIPNKSLMGLPWRYALRCIDDLGLILRAEIIWNKPNGLPESVTDRVRRSHETWFHFTLQPRYYSAVDEIREPQQTNGERHVGRSGWVNATGPGANGVARSFTERDLNPLGKLPGSVWQIPSEPLTVPDHLGVDHFAAFPLEWPRRLIRGWCPAEVCTACGEGRRPVTEGTPMVVRPSARREAAHAAGAGSGRTTTSGTMLEPPRNYIAGYVCACTPHTDHPERRGKSTHPHEHDGERGHKIGSPSIDADGNYANGKLTLPIREYHFDAWTPPPSTPGVVLDPFGGTGTTALAALALGRDAIHVDLSADYNRIAEWRTTDRDQLAKAMQVQRSDAAKEADLYDMEPLFGGI